MKRSRVRTSWMLGALALTVTAAGVSACEGDDGDGEAVINSDSGAPDTASPGDANVADTAAPPLDAALDAACASGSCVVALSVNGHDSCALMNDTTVRCWGSNNLGELGFGMPDASTVAFINIATPTAVPGLSGVQSMAIGGFYDGSQEGFTCALLADAGALCWGVDEDGQLGRGDAGPDYADSHPAPVLLPSPIVQMSAGPDTTCAVTNGADVLCWGDNSAQNVSATLGTPITVPTTVVAAAKFTQVSVGVSVCAVSTDKHVWCWGRSLFGSTGRVVTDGGLQDIVPAQLDGLDDVVEVAAGAPGACALTGDGVVHCWGGAAPIPGNSLLGRGDVDSGKFDPTPASVVMPTGVTFKQLVAHSYGFCALDQSGSVWCWGNNYYDSNAITYADGGGVYPVWFPAQVTSVSNIVQIASGSGAMHVCTLDRNGSVKCWGYNMYDQLGTAVVDGGAPASLVPIDVVFP